MTNRLELSWKLDGFVDEQHYYCSETPIDPLNLSAPKAILTGDVRAYTDTAIDIGKTYYICVGSIRNGVEKLSSQVPIHVGSNNIPDVQNQTLSKSDLMTTIQRPRGGVVLDDGSYIVSGYNFGAAQGSVIHCSKLGTVLYTLRTSADITSFSIIDDKYLFVRMINKLSLYELSVKNDLSSATLVSNITNFSITDNVNALTVFCNKKTAITHSRSTVDASYNINVTILNGDLLLNSVASNTTYNIKNKLSIINPATYLISGFTMSNFGLDLVIVTSIYNSTSTKRIHFLKLSTPFDLSTAVEQYHKDVDGILAAMAYPLSFNESQKKFLFGSDELKFHVYSYA